MKLYKTSEREVATYHALKLLKIIHPAIIIKIKTINIMFHIYTNTNKLRHTFNNEQWIRNLKHYRHA